MNENQPTSTHEGGMAEAQVQGVVESPVEQLTVNQEVLSSLMTAGRDAAYTGKMNLSRESVQSLSEADQAALANAYFEKTIGQSISNNKQAYEVYKALKGTSFGHKFAQLEDTRLKEAGYEGFTL